jgi:hypothetical protein
VTTWIVCGGRVGRNLTRARTWAVLDSMALNWPDEEITVVHGGAAFVDRWAGAWARHHGHHEVEVRVDGELDGYKQDAPKNRNRRIREEAPGADCCLGFPGGGGTNDMLEISHNAGIPVADVEIDYDGNFQVKWWPQK